MYIERNLVIGKSIFDSITLYFSANCEILNLFTFIQSQQKLPVSKPFIKHHHPLVVVYISKFVVCLTVIQIRTSWHRQLHGTSSNTSFNARDPPLDVADVNMPKGILKRTPSNTSTVSTVSINKYHWRVFISDEWLLCV